MNEKQTVATPRAGISWTKNTTFI